MTTKIVVRITFDGVNISFVIRIFQTACNKRRLRNTFFVTKRCLIILAFAVTNIWFLHIFIININVRCICTIFNIVVGRFYSVQYKSIFGALDKVRRDTFEEARLLRLDFQRER